MCLRTRHKVIANPMISTPSFHSLGSAAPIRFRAILFLLPVLLLGSASIAHAQSRGRVVCFGDSITKRGYPSILGALLGVETVNAGVAGHTSGEGLRRMSADVLEKKPDVVVIFFGTNDIRVDNEKKHTPPPQYQSNLETMIKACRDQGAGVVVCTLPPINADTYFKRHDRDVYEAAGGLEDLIQAQRLAAVSVAERHKAPLVDLHKRLAMEPQWMSGDGVHPGKEGNAIIAKHIAKAVAPLLPAGLKASPQINGSVHTSDIVIYGATSAGVMAAVQASRMNKSVVLIEPGDHIGGLTSGGLGATDIGNKDVIGGLSREFYRRVSKHYQQEDNWVHESRQAFFQMRSKRTTLEEILGEEGTMWTFEPHVADTVFRQLLKASGIRVRLRQRLAEVIKSGSRIQEVGSTDGTRYRAAMFIDASYEGDLMARAEVRYHVGREPNSLYGETLNGIRDKTPKNQMAGNVDPYISPGDPDSGLIPLIAPGDGGRPGDGDHRVQAYNFRLCFTDVPANRMALHPPTDYDPALYELAARQVQTRLAMGADLNITKFCNPVWMPNRKTDINNSLGISTDYIGANYDYPDADYDTRAKIRQAHADYIRGFWYFMSTDPRIPESLRNAFLVLGPCRDEFVKNGGWPTQLYIREARRMISDYVMTEHNCRGKVIAKDSVGMAAYGMDSHNCQRIVQNGIVRNEGDVQQHGLKPYPISYRSIVPAESECENLLVPVCLSASHIAFGSIRMEPVFMVLGQSSAVAASLAMDNDTTVQQVDYAELRLLLWGSGQVLARPDKQTTR